MHKYNGVGSLTRDDSRGVALIEKGEVTRNDHFGFPIICKDPVVVSPEEQGYMLEESIITPNH